MEVEPLDSNSPKRQHRPRLLPVLLGIILMVQVCAAHDDLQVDTSVLPSQVSLGQSVTISARVYDRDIPGVPMANVTVTILVVTPSGTSEYLTASTNPSSLATITYTPLETGNYGMLGIAVVNYSTIPRLPNEGIEVSSTPPYSVPMNSLSVSVGPPVIPGSSTLTGAPPVPLTTAAAVQPVTSAEPREPRPSPAPASSPAGTPSFPLPLWLVGIIIFIIVVAAGGAIYLESQQRKGEEKK